jgi:hypothetical protein
MHSGTPICTRSDGRKRRTGPSGTPRPRSGRLRAAPHRGVDRGRAMSSPTSRLANPSSGTRRRRRWSVPPEISTRSHCGPDRALPSPGSRNQQQRLWPSSSLACNRSRRLDRSNRRRRRPSLTGTSSGESAPVLAAERSAWRPHERLQRVVAVGVLSDSCSAAVWGCGRESTFDCFGESAADGLRSFRLWSAPWLCGVWFEGL